MGGMHWLQRRELNGYHDVASAGVRAPRHTSRFRRQDAIKNLTPEQALEVVKRLSGKGGKIQEAVLAEARDVLSEIDLDETADEVFFVLDSIDVQDCWDRAGSSRNGYTSPDEAAVEIMEERLQPFLDQTRRYHELGMPGEEMTHCMGLILGIYRYEHESKSKFRYAEFFQGIASLSTSDGPELGEARIHREDAW